MIKKALVICLALILVACSSTGKPPQPTEIPEEITTTIEPTPIYRPDLPYLQVVGNKIVNENGEIVILRGLGPQPIINLAITDWDVPWNEDIFKEMHAWGATTVRLLVSPGRFFDNVESGLEILDQAIEWAGKYDMYVLLTYTSIGFPTTGFFSHPSTAVEVTTEAELIRFWQIVSERYAGNNQIAVYEIINEAVSHNWDGKTYLEDWLILKDFTELVIDLIRVNDPDTIILVSGLKWATDLSYVLDYPIQRSNVAYAMHLFPNTINWDTAFGHVAQKFPVILAETTFGVNVEGTYSWINEEGFPGDKPFREQLIEYIEENGLSWNAVPFSKVYEPPLLTDNTFTPNEVGAFFREHLLSHDWNVGTGEYISADLKVFSGAVGEWKSTDPTDGSQRTLTINPADGNTYAIRYKDAMVDLCTRNLEKAGGLATGEGKAFFQKLDIGPVHFSCEDGLSTGGLIYESFLYDEELDTLTDIAGTVWSRSSSVVFDPNQSAFLGAVGSWMCLDGSDGSTQTLVVEHLEGNQYSIVYSDDRASICGTDENNNSLYTARAEVIGISPTNVVEVDLRFTCFGDTEWETDVFPTTFEYNSLTDKVSDSFYNTWNRTE